MTTLSLPLWADPTLQIDAAIKAKTGLEEKLKDEVRAGRLSDMKFKVEVGICHEGGNLPFDYASNCQELIPDDLESLGARYCLEIYYSKRVGRTLDPLWTLLNSPANRPTIPSFEEFNVRAVKRKSRF
jgi:hypothetical protein